LAQYGTADLVMPEARIALMAELLTSIMCAICHRPVRLEECKADDFGRRVHEMCFAEWMIEDQKKETRKQT
jgi:antirestriction protein